MSKSLNLQEGSWAYTKDLTDEQYMLFIELMVEASASEVCPNDLNTKDCGGVVFWDWSNNVNHVKEKLYFHKYANQVTPEQLQAILDERKQPEVTPEPPTELLSNVMELKALNKQLDDLSKRRGELVESICDELEIC